MVNASFFRVSGIALIIGGLILLTAPVRQMYCAPNIGGIFCDIFKGSFLLGSILILLGVVGIYLGMANKAGTFGLISFIVVFFGGAMHVGTDWMHTFVEPLLQTVAPDVMESDTPPLSIMIGFMLSFPLYILGWILFGTSIIRTRVFPKWAVLLVMVGFILDFVPIPFPVSPILVGIGLIWLGYALQGNIRRLRNEQNTLEVPMN